MIWIMIPFCIAWLSGMASAWNKSRNSIVGDFFQSLIIAGATSAAIYSSIENGGGIATRHPELGALIVVAMLAVLVAVFWLKLRFGKEG